MQIKSSIIRKQFIDFFKNKHHKLIRSSPVVPIDDPTLLFINAGMNQFKPYFIGNKSIETKRVVNSQKCIRVSGKHNDLEEVGVDEYHHTFFEMLGNWSFGDYYKKDAIMWAWELLTEVWKLDKDRIWVTIFKEDNETGELWVQNTDIDPERILKFGHKDNFWEMGETGPCGPCTEIHYFTGKNINEQKADGVNLLNNYREIWNLVFIQYNRNEKGELEDLPEKHVDTGAGFERLVAILNGEDSNYNTDLFIPIIEEIIEISGKKIDFENGVPHRVIADHVRMLVFSLADGAIPSNEGRGYVVRRVLRRAARFGRKLEIKEPFIYKLTNIVSDVMGHTYPEVIEKNNYISKVIYAEEISFNETLDRGLAEFNKIKSTLGASKYITGEYTFKLYDTFGFPLDLTELLARENGLSVDVIGFNEFMSKQKKRARDSGKFYQTNNDKDWILVGKEQKTNFIGYDYNSKSVKLIKYKKYADRYEIVLDKTPFYAESGGQVSDQGLLKANNFRFKVDDVQNINDELIHIGTLQNGDFDDISSLNAEINIARREKIRRNHTATHLLHQALKEVLGDHIQQAGSLVESNYLRFDLTHFEKISDKEIVKIENIINKVILENRSVEISIKDYKEAKKDGAISLFGEKYDDEVRVVNVLDFSKELCGGTHVSQTGDIGCIKITSESALSSGVRRITAITGEAISNLLTYQERMINDIKDELKCSNSEILIKLQKLKKNNKILEKENKKLKNLTILDNIEDLIKNSIDYNGIRLVVNKLDNIEDLKVLGDRFRQAFKSNGICLIGTIQQKKPIIMCAITDDLLKNINASKIISKVGKFMGGGGGGKPHIATAGGNKINILSDALSYGKELIKSIIENK